MSSNAAAGIAHQPLGRLFLRFLRFGLLAWGGPVAQIAMLRRSMVEEERWVSGEHFNRALALYQVLPGPEAHELCVYFGMLARGRIGGVLAGLGFMLPGFLLMFALSWAYVSLGLDVHGELAVLFAVVQAAVIALIVRAVHRIGRHVLLNAWLWTIAVVGAAAHFAGVHFALILSGAGLVYLLLPASRVAAGACVVIAGFATLFWHLTHPGNALIAASAAEGIASQSVSLAALFWSGLKAGSLTFGGAYTVIPFLQRDAVSTGAWMSNAQFMDGIALTGLLPAPLVIFATFVGYVGGGPAGAAVMTIGVFLPAFALTLIAHQPMERLLHMSRVRIFLDGVTAGVVGLIGATALGLMLANIREPLSGAVFLVALAILFFWNHRFVIPIVIAGAAITGLAAIATSH
ncbi:MAG: chromate efflux transporter [Pseudomonadota bacterium]|nr:chromate efflux transporter [Pseudomonadota bacterium]